MKRRSAEALVASLADVKISTIMLVNAGAEPGIHGEADYAVAIAPQQDINVRNLIIAADEHGFDVFFAADGSWRLVPPPEGIPEDANVVPEEEVWACTCQPGYVSTTCDVPEHRERAIKLHRGEPYKPPPWHGQARTVENDHMWTGTGT